MRKILLKDTMTILNDWLYQHVRLPSLDIHTPSKCLYHAGLILPVLSFTDEGSVRVVTGLAASMSRVFNTKTRAPYMVPLQTVKLSEVRERLEAAAKEVEEEGRLAALTPN